MKFIFWNARPSLGLLVAGASFCLLRTAWSGQSARPVNVVLVHGILNTGKIFAPLVKRLESEGCRCFAPSLRPNTGALGVHDLAGKLSAQIDQHFGPKEPFVIVGFSMGGVVTRDYVQNLANRKRVRGVFLISTPNHGTFWACLSPGGGIRDLAIGSAFLQRLNADSTAWNGIPVSSYWTPYDLMIMPASSSLWPVGETRRIVCPLHPMMGEKPRRNGRTSPLKLPECVAITRRQLPTTDATSLDPR